MKFCKTPGTIGVSFRNANRLLDALEQLGTEPHGLLVSRHGQIGLEGYWAPYGPGVIHGCQSLTKTVTGIALGAAIQEGLLSLEDRLIDIFPEYAHLTQGCPYWDELKVRHIASMGAGMDAQPQVTSPDWIEDFFRMEIHHKPGTAYMYNSIGCSMVGACIRKKTGQGLLDFMRDRVFSRIGIDASALGWYTHADGLENGSGGFIANVRVNASLMELYRRRGVWDGERILAEEWVDFALQVQNPHVGGDALYGGMLWIREPCFVADGAMGQWSMYFPEKDAVIAVNQTIAAPYVDNQVRQAIYDFVDSLEDAEVTWAEGELRSMNRRLQTLSIPKAPYGENRALLRRLNGKKLKIENGFAHFFADDLNIFRLDYVAPVESFIFHICGGDLELEISALGKTVRCQVGMRGYRTICHVENPTPNPACTAAIAGYFLSESVMQVEVRWLESCRIHLITFQFNEAGAEITTHRVPVGGFDVPDEAVRAYWC